MMNSKKCEISLARSLCLRDLVSLCCIYCILTSVNILAEDPWGKDAELTAPCSSNNKPIIHPTSLMARMGEACIRFHQEVISPADGPRSHFIPSSSQYTLDAMRKYGFIKGYTMGCDRLMRENDEEWVYRKTADGLGRPMKWDPVK